MAAKYVLFDFDGTLFDTGPGITNCLREAFLKCGYAVAPDDDESLPKSQIVARAMQKIGAVPAETVMIGDRKFDVLGAATNGIPCIGLDTGFGEKNELQKAGAVFVVKTYTELEKLFFEK